MTPKKTQRADLEKKKALFFEAGLAVSLALAIVVFSAGRTEKALPPPPVENGEPYVPVMMPLIRDEPMQAQAVVPLRVPDGMLKIVPDITTIETGPLVFDEPEFGNTFGKGSPYSGGSPSGVGPIALGDEPFILVEDMPRFQGGDIEKFRNWVLGKISYPPMAQSFGIIGKVVLSFVVERDGRVSSIEVLSSPDKLLSDEAVRVIGRSPVWTPGRQRDVPVRVKFVIPIDFVLN